MQALRVTEWWIHWISIVVFIYIALVIEVLLPFVMGVKVPTRPKELQASRILFEIVISKIYCVCSSIVVI